MPRSDSASAAGITASRRRVATAKAIFEETFTPRAFDDTMPGDRSEPHELPSSQLSTARQPGQSSTLQSSTLQTPAPSPRGEPGSDLSLEDLARISLSKLGRSSNEAHNSRYAHPDSDSHSFTSSESKAPTINLGSSALDATRASFNYDQIFERLHKFRGDSHKTTANNAATTQHKGYAQQYQQRRAQTSLMQHHKITPPRALDHVNLDLAATHGPLSIPTEAAHGITATNRTNSRTRATTPRVRVSQTHGTFYGNEADIKALKDRYEREVMTGFTQMASHLRSTLGDNIQEKYIDELKAKSDQTQSMIRDSSANIPKLQQTMQDFYTFRNTVLASRRPGTSSNTRP